jgi:hypothetical protein
MADRRSAGRVTSFVPGLCTCEAASWAAWERTHPSAAGKVAEVDRVLGQILRQAVWDRLDMLDELASSADNGSLLSVARSELPRLTYGWRALLATHAPDPRGRCPECSSRWRPRASPCSVWRAAHEHLVSAEAMPQAWQAPFSVSAGVA